MCVCERKSRSKCCTLRLGEPARLGTVGRAPWGKGFKIFSTHTHTHQHLPPQVNQYGRVSSPLIKRSAVCSTVLSEGAMRSVSVAEHGALPFRLCTSSGICIWGMLQLFILVIKDFNKHSCIVLFLRERPGDDTHNVLLIAFLIKYSTLVQVTF